MVIDGVNFGAIYDFGGRGFVYFPRRTDLLTGDHYIAIGKELNKLNNR